MRPGAARLSRPLQLALDAAMRATEGRLIAANATGCLEVFSTPFPESSWQLPWIHSLFGNAPAVATGIQAALKAKSRTDVRVIGQGGDGGTLDIGFACLSGMFERNDDVLTERIEPRPLHFLDLDTEVVERELGRILGEGRSGAHAENILRDLGLVAARPH